MAQKKENTVAIAERLAKPVIDERGLILWDTRFEKEGSQWYLRYFIDNENGVSMDDLEFVSRAVDKLLDAADPIDASYILEVSSPGIERELVRDWHFEQYIGSLVTVHFIRAVDGKRDFVGELLSKDGDEIKILLSDNDNDEENDEEIVMTFNKSEAASVRLVELLKLED